MNCDAAFGNIQLFVGAGRERDSPSSLPRQRPHGAQPFLCILPETAEAYGIAAGELAYGAPPRPSLRAAYARAGYGHGHRAGLLLENRPAFFLHWFALNALGVSVVPINPDLRAAELEYLAGNRAGRGPARPPR